MLLSIYRGIPMRLEDRPGGGTGGAAGDGGGSRRLPVPRGCVRRETHERFPATGGRDRRMWAVVGPHSPGARPCAIGVDKRAEAADWPMMNTDDDVDDDDDDDDDDLLALVCMQYGSVTGMHSSYER